MQRIVRGGCGGGMGEGEEAGEFFLSQKSHEQSWKKHLKTDVKR